LLQDCTERQRIAKQTRWRCSADSDTLKETMPWVRLCRWRLLAYNNMDIGGEGAVWAAVGKLQTESGASGAAAPMEVSPLLWKWRKRTR